MTRTEHLLAKVAEECAEIAQRATKAMRFGLSEVQPGQPKTNAERLVDELLDLYAVVEMLETEDLIPVPDLATTLDERIARVEKYLAYSRSLGALRDEPSPPIRTEGAG